MSEQRVELVFRCSFVTLIAREFYIISISSCDLLRIAKNVEQLLLKWRREIIFVLDEYYWNF
jgi:hypothetical protein